MASNNEAKVKFTAETSDFNSAIKDANSEMSSLRAELKLADATFQNTGDSVEYLQQKHDLLEEALEANQDKQDALNGKIEAATEIFGEDSSEVQNLEKQLTNAKTEEQKLTTQLNETNAELENQTESTEEVADAMDEASDSSDGMSDAFGTLKDVVVGGAIAAAVKEVAEALYDLAEEYDEAKDIIVQGTGATGDALDGLLESAQVVFSGVQRSASVSLSDVSETLAEVNTRTGLYGEELEDLTITISDFAVVTGQDGVSAVDDLMNIMSYWGLTLEDIPDLMDDITTASQGCQASASDLQGALYDNAGAFETLGYSTEEALAFLTTYSANGGDVAEVSGWMSKAISNLSDTTDDVPGAFQAAIDAIASCDTTAEALQMQVADTGLTVEDVFGTKNAQKLAQNIQSGTTSTDEWTTALENNSGALEQTVEDSATMSDSITTAMNTIKSNASTVFSPAIESMVTGVADASTDIVTYFTDAGGVVDGFSQIIDSLAEEANNTVEDLKEWGATVTENIATGITEGAQNVLQAGKDMIGEIGNAVTESISDLQEWGGTVIDNVVDGIRNAFSDLLSAGTDAIDEFISGITSIDLTEVGANIIAGVKNGITGAASDLVSAATEAGQGFLDSFCGFFGINSPSTVMEEQGEYIGEGLQNGVESMPDDFDETLQDMVDKVLAWADIMDYQSENAAETFSDNIESGIKKLPTTVNSTLTDIKNKTNTWSTTLTKLAKTTATNFTSNIKSGLSSLPTNVNSTLTSVQSKVTSWGTTFTSNGKTYATNFTSNVKSGISSLPTSVSSTLTSTQSKVTSWGSTFASSGKTYGANFTSNLKSGMSGITSSVSSALSGVTSYVSSWGSTLYSKFYSIGRNVMSGLKSGISSMVSSLYSTIYSSLSGLVSKAKSALGIASPSKVMAEEVGQYILPGVGVGIEDTESDLYDTVQDAVSGLSDVDMPELSASISADALTSTSGAFGQMAESIQDYISTAIESALGDEIDRMVDAVEALANRPIYLNINGRTFANATAGDVDKAQGTRQTLVARGLSIA